MDYDSDLLEVEIELESASTGETTDALMMIDTTSGAIRGVFTRPSNGDGGLAAVDDLASGDRIRIVTMQWNENTGKTGSVTSDTVLTVGDLRLDPGRRTFSVGDEPVSLTPTEFSIMELLMSRPGDVFSKADILDSCWEWAFEGDPNIVEVYIRYLRRKIDIPFDRAVIQTVRGAGYRLVEHG